MMQFVAPFLINFGINKAMGMSTGKALGMAGINSFYLEAELHPKQLEELVDYFIKVEATCNN